MSDRRSSFLGGFKNRLQRSSPDTHQKPFTTAPPTRRPNRSGMNAFTTQSTEPPPAYSPRGTASPAGHTTIPSQPPPTFTASTADDPYAFLSSFDTVFVIDDSGSMAGRSWRECHAALAAITPICTAHDADGIDLHFLNAPDMPVNHNVTASSTIAEIFSTVRPSGGTPTGQVLNRILRQYLCEFEADREATKPMNVIVITDGVPSDDVESVLVRAAKKLDTLDADAWQLGVQFVQVGEEEGAKEHLEGLDDELCEMGGGCRDIVDTVPFNRGQSLSAEVILKVVLGAVNKRLDRRRNA